MSAVYHYLETVEEAGGERHYIDGVAVHAGDPILVMVNGSWKNARYEARWRAGGITGAWACRDDGDMRLTDETPVALP